MRSLFLKIFLWFWLTVTLVGAILVVIALTTDQDQAELARLTRRFAASGNRLVGIYEEQGLPALMEATGRLREQEKGYFLLFREDLGPLTGRPMPPRFEKFLGQAARSAGGPPPPRPGPGRHWFGGREEIVAIPLDQGYKLLVQVPPPTKMQQLLDPRALTLRLLVTILVAGIVCYLLARSLTAPLAKLRQATREIAAGNLAIRVAPRLGRQSEEIAALAGDFDRMTGRLEALLLAQQQLLRDISHELRSPLARLGVALELARRHGVGHNDSFLDKIGIEAERLNDLIGQLLALTRLEGSGATPETATVELADLLERIAVDADFEAAPRARRVRLTTRQRVSINGNRELLHRAIENVVRNGVWYTAEQTEVEIVLDSRGKNGPAEAVITVLDHGPGVPEESLSSLFRPFYRVGEARDRQSGGAGVGLAIAERAIRLHGGTIAATNSPSGGLLITIVLPRDGMIGVA